MAIFKLLKEIYVTWRNDNASQIAAALSYYFLFSAAPLFILISYLMGLIFDKQIVRTELSDKLASIVGQQVAQDFFNVVNYVNLYFTTHYYSIYIGIIILIIAALAFFIQLQSGLNQIWGVASRTNTSYFYIITDRFIAFILVMLITILLVMSVMLNSIIKIFINYSQYILPGNLTLHALNILISFILITFFLAFIFKILPDVSNRWVDVWVSAIITSILFTFGKVVIEWYIGSNILSIYGTFASVIVIMLWVYYSCQIIFLGAVFSKINAYKHGTKIRPIKHAKFIHPKSYKATIHLESKPH